MTLVKLLSERAGQRIALVVLLFLASALLLLTFLNAASPVIDLAYGDTTIKMAADRAWTYFPGDCVNISWELEGIKSLYIEGEGKIGQGEMAFCPSINATSPLIEVTAKNSIYRRLDLELHHLPDMIFYLVSFVGLVGSCLLAAYYLCASTNLTAPLPMYWLLIGALILSVIGGWIRLRPTHLPILDEDTGDVAVRFWAENDRILFPHECVKVWWSVVGDVELTFNGISVPAEDYIGKGTHCAENGDNATLEVLANDRSWRTYELPIPSLFSTSQTPAPYYLWSIIAILLGILVYMPLAIQTLRRNWQSGARSDIVSCIGCFLFALVFYLPFGFDSAALYEEWVVHSYFDGRSASYLGPELVSRFWVLTPHTLAYLISSDSFVGYHLVHFLTLVGKMILLYGVLRQLKISPFYSFLIAVLFMVYPVNSGLLSLRSLPLNFSMLCLLAAVYFALDYCRNPRRLALMGVWLALMFNVASNESAFVVILVVPLLWWQREPRLNWRNFNLTGIWYLAPAFKVAYLILLFASDRGFYRQEYFGPNSNTSNTASDILATMSEVLSTIYRHTFLEGWHDAITSVATNQWWIWTFCALTIAGVISYNLMSNSNNAVAPGARRIGTWLVIGFLFIIPAVGVLMWISRYQFDLWRLYFYVPIGGATVIFCGILLLVAPFRRSKYHSTALLAICLLLIIPATSRLLAQHDRYKQSADSKALVLRRILQLVPHPHPDTELMLWTEFDFPGLTEADISELFRRDVLYSALLTLYGGDRPQTAYFCLSILECGLEAGTPSVYHPDMNSDRLQRTLALELKSDLTLELVEDPFAFFAWNMTLPYDASQLHDVHASLPHRTKSMLASVMRN